MNVLTYKAHLLDPLLATTIEGEPNSRTSLSYVPGSMVRGALANRYLQGNSIDAANNDCRRLFFDGRSVYLNLYPLDRRDQRTLPTPRSWFCEKDDQDGGPFYDLSLEDEDLQQPQVCKHPFCWRHPEDDKVEFCSPARRLKVHSQRDRRKGRSTELVGEIFRYDAIAPGETFGGVILTENSHDQETLRGFLEGTDLLLGGSHSAGYGRVQIKDLQISEEADWREVGEPREGIEEKGPIVVALLSDTIIRDGNGQHHGDLNDCEVAKMIGIKPDQLHRKAAFKKTGVVGGFNRKWGLPLPQTLALEAGSVFVYESDVTISPEAIAQLENHGLGERRVEGFGRVIVNWNNAEELGVLKIAPTARDTVSLSSTSTEIAEQMVKRLLRRELDRKLQKRINEITMANSPHNSQLSRLRMIANKALASENLQLIKQYTEDMRKTAKSQFGDAKIGDQVSLEWINDRIQENDEKLVSDVWAMLGVSEQDLPQIGDLKAELTVDLAREYQARLIEGVMAKAAKDRKLQGD